MLFSSFLLPKAMAAQLPSDLRGEVIPFLPYLEYMVDEKGNLDIESIALQEKSLQFQPLRPLDLELGSGIFWLRFTIGPLSEGEKAVEWLLSLGESLPGDPQLYVPEIQNESGMQQWQVRQVTDRHILTLPEAGTEARTCYIRLAGPPGLWFAPMLRSPHNAANNWGALSHPAAVLGLGVIMLLCLLRSFSEQGQWRIWTAIYVAGALAAGYLGLPALEKGHIGFDQFATALAPGVALMVLPHVARHLMRTNLFSRMVDAQLILLTLVGACVTLLPLIPGLAFTSRFLELWPLGMIFFIPTALWALFMGLPGSQRFLLICIIPPMCTAAGLLGLLSGLPADMLSALPLCGIAISALMLVAAPNPPTERTIEKKDKGKTGEDTITLNDQLEDPNLKIIALEPPAALTDSLPLNDIRSQDLPPLPEPQALPSILEEALQEPIEALRRSSDEFEKCSLPTAARVQAKNILEHARKILGIVDGSLSFVQEENDTNRAAIDLQIMMRDIYNHALQSGKDTELALGWYMPPHLSSLYSGDMKKLKNVLQMLVESAVRATEHGSVHFTVRQYPESSDPGHLLFTVKDTGAGVPPKERSGLALTRAWELAASCQGSLTFQSGPEGTTVHLGLHLLNLDATEDQEKLNQKPLVLICSERADMRHELTRMLEDMDCRTATAQNLKEAETKHAKDPASLIIVHDTLATPQAQPIILAIRRNAQEMKLPFCKILAITKTDLSWKKLGEAGFTLALLEPLDVEALQTTVQDVIDEYRHALAEKSQTSSKPQKQVMPDLFGTGDSVPKDIDELRNISKLIQTFSDLGTDAETNKTGGTAVASEDPIFSVAEQKDLTVSKSEGETTSRSLVPETKESFSEKSPAPTSAQATIKETGSTTAIKSTDIPEAANDVENVVQVEATSIEKKQTETLTPNHSELSLDKAKSERPAEINAFDAALMDEKWAGNGEPNVLLRHNFSNDTDTGQKEAEIPSHSAVRYRPERTPFPEVAQESALRTEKGGTWFTPDEWVGEPVPITSEKENLKTHEDLASASASDSSEQVRSKDSDHYTSYAEPFRPMTEADEWVGEPFPVTSAGQSPKEKPGLAKDSAIAFKNEPETGSASEDANEWVGEPFPVTSATERKIEDTQRTGTTMSAKEPLNLSLRRDWEQSWEDEHIPALADAAVAPSGLATEDERRKGQHQKNADPLVKSMPKSETESGNENNVLDFIKGTVDENGPLAIVKAENSEKAEEKSGRGPDPALLELVRRLNEAVEDAEKALAASQSMRVAEAAGRIAAECEAFSFRILARVARCVEQAGKAGDLTALKDLLPELAHQVERNNIALTQIR